MANTLRTRLIGGGILLYIVVTVPLALLHLFSWPGDLQQEPFGEAPNGKIAFISARDGAYGIYVMNPDGSGKTRLTDATSYSGLTWSPDGEQLAFSVGDGVGSGDIYVMNDDGSDKTRLTGALGGMSRSISDHRFGRPMVRR